MDYLVIFQCVPENLYIYHFYNPDAETCQMLEKCHGQYVNSVDCPKDVEEFLSNLSEENKVFDDTDASNYIPEFKTLTTPKIIVTGMIL